ncbi:MAG: NADH:ubiquinone oxidoreductase subunit NDUFA12 [Micavibrio sp.]|nr:NADH:ubiquinone oxidoreductase subunit NDUFA12 [Micavibrio sp.]|tara:strand:- start:2942 stop:3343 length:402 start_codon:yes stop_codon:yes gene_type:complete
MLNWILSVSSPLHSLMTIWQKGKKIGDDPYGNVYYQGKSKKGYKRPRRWVSYKDIKRQESSVIPPEWHGWLHYQTDVFPDKDKPTYRKTWQLAHKENMTGTAMAYKPKGSLSRGGKRAKASGDYQAWTPESDL